MTSLEQEQIEVAAKRAVALLETASIKALVVIEKAAANGLATKTEIESYRKSINRTTWVAGIAAATAMILGCLGVLTYLLTPVIKEQDGQRAEIREIQKDLREFYRVGVNGYSERLSTPLPPAPPPRAAP